MQLVELNNSNTTALTTKTGKVVGNRYTFLGVNKASDIRAAGKAIGLKGEALNDYVNKALTNAKDAANASMAVAVSALTSKGYIPDYTDVRATSATIRMVKPKDAKPKVETKEDLIAKLAATFGMEVEALAKLLPAAAPKTVNV